MTASRKVGFDGWTLHRDTGELRRDGVRVRLQSQPLQVLDALLERPGDLVTRETLIARLWPRGIVDFDTALNSAVRRLRTALRDHADVPRYIETIPKRGYRFIGRLDPVDAETLTPPGAAPTVSADDATSVVVAPPAKVRGRSLPRLAAAAALGGLALTTLLAWPALRSPATSSVASSLGKPSTVPAAAEVSYRQGRFLLQRRGPGDVAQARERFEAALALAPELARAWAGIASTYWLDTVEHRLAREEGLVATRAAAERALAIDPGVAEAHVRLANVAWLAGDAAAGNLHLRRAMTLEPGDPLVLTFAAVKAIGDASLGDAIQSGALDEAIALQRRAVEADPLAVAGRQNLAAYLYIAGRYGEAEAVLDELRRIRSDDGSSSLLGQTLVLNGDYDAALRVASQVHDDAARRQILALAFHALGRHEQAEHELQALVTAVDARRSYLVAEVHAFRGEADAAFRWLELAVAGADSGECPVELCTPLEWVEVSPLLRPLALDARWQRWVEHVRARTAG
jgi:DNA-binding winged helix-turn-helix (wHTH) protein/tetratricopeptide (TPR) repeat protein